MGASYDGPEVMLSQMCKSACAEPMGASYDGPEVMLSQLCKSFHRILEVDESTPASPNSRLPKNNRRWVFVVPLKGMIHSARFVTISVGQAVDVQLLLGPEFAVWKMIASAMLSFLDRFILLRLV